MTRRRVLAPTVLLGTVALAAGALASWKEASLDSEAATAASQPEPVESVTVADARLLEHVQTTTSIGTVLALRSVVLRNELAGTVRQVALEPGAVVEEGTVLVALDVDVETAELAALQSEVELATTVLGRIEQASAGGGVSDVDVDRARAELDIARARADRAQAVIERKTIRAPFRARVGLSDVHPGQYLEEGTQLTTLQGVDEAVHVDFTVGQDVAARLRAGDRVDVDAGHGSPRAAVVVAVDARVDVETRNAWVRARLDAPLSPGASVRVLVPVGPPGDSVVVPVSALRKGPDGDHVFVVAPDEAGQQRAHIRPVQSGTVLGDEVVIESGLAAGEQVAASGSFKLRDKLLVAIAEGAAEGQGVR
jgi:membrane fusion protein, multidrug efflux system